MSPSIVTHEKRGRLVQPLCLQDAFEQHPDLLRRKIDPLPALQPQPAGREHLLTSKIVKWLTRIRDQREQAIRAER